MADTQAHVRVGHPPPGARDGAAGRSDNEIREYLVDRYGEIILLRPRWSVANAWLWLAPGLFLIGGVLIAWRIVAAAARVAGHRHD